MRRLCGKLVWASRPWRGAVPFVSGALAWLNWSYKQSKCTPPTVLRGLMEAFALGITPWKAAPTLNSIEETWYVGAVYHNFHWTAALWTPTCGMRIKKLPLWVAPWQGTKLAAVEMATSPRWGGVPQVAQRGGLDGGGGGNAGDGEVDRLPLVDCATLGVL